MSIYGAILPRGRDWHGSRRSRSLEAKPRWYQEHGEKVRLAARHFGFIPDTMSRWVRAYRWEGLPDLETKSRRPKMVRLPQAPVEVVQRIQSLREQYLRCGREKLRVLLERERITIAAKGIDLVLARLRSQWSAAGASLRPRKDARWHQKRLRRPKELVVYQFWVVDCFTR